MARVSEHRSSVQGNSDRISTTVAVLSLDGCGKAGLGCTPFFFFFFLCFLFFFFFPSEALVGKPRKTHRFIPGADSRNQSAEGEAV